MSQPALFDVQAEVKLTPRQQLVYTALKTAGHRGVEASEAGALLHADKHSKDAPCKWCPSTGNDVLRALRTKGLAKYRRKIGAWTLSKVPPETDERGLLPGQSWEIPY